MTTSHKQRQFQAEMAHKAMAKVKADRQARQEAHETAKRIARAKPPKAWKKEAEL